MGTEKVGSFVGSLPPALEVIKATRSDEKTSRGYWVAAQDVSKETEKWAKWAALA